MRSAPLKDNLALSFKVFLAALFLNINDVNVVYMQIAYLAVLPVILTVF